MVWHFRIDGEIELKAPEPSDAEAFFRLLDGSREFVAKWMDWVDDIKSMDDMSRSIGEALERFTTRNGLTVGIWFKGEPTGVINLWGADSDARYAEISYWIGRQFQGLGLVTRSCPALLDYAFRELGLNRVEIRCADENLKSRAIPERLGFKLEGQIRDCIKHADRYYDELVFGMLAKEWNERSR